MCQRKAALAGSPTFTFGPKVISIRIHSQDHARAALTAAAELDKAVMLVSPVMAGAFAGIGWWRELVCLMTEEFPRIPLSAVLDCGPAPGLALAAIRAGIGHVWLDVEPAMAAKIASIAEQAGARVDRGTVTLDLLGVPEPGPACREVLL